MKTYIWISNEDIHSIKDKQSIMILKSYMLGPPLTLFLKLIVKHDSIWFFPQEMTWMGETIKWRCKSGRSSEEKHFIKKDKQPLMIFKSYWQYSHQLYFLYNMSFLKWFLFFTYKLYWRTQISSEDENLKEVVKTNIPWRWTTNQSWFLIVIC